MTFGTTATPHSVFAALVAVKMHAADARPTTHADMRNTAFVHIAATLEISERALQHRLDFHFFAFSLLHGTRDAHLEQLAKWILLSPIQRYLFARKLWLPRDERQFAMEEEELANIAKESMRVEIGRHASYLATLSVIEVRARARALRSIIRRGDVVQYDSYFRLTPLFALSLLCIWMYFHTHTGTAPCTHTCMHTHTHTLSLSTV